MSSTQSVDQPAGTYQAELRSLIARLFGFTEESVAAERRLEARVSALAHDFLRANEVSSTVELEWLREAYAHGDIPVEPSDVESYVEGLADSLLAHSVHTSSPRFIGHMTSALPYFVRPLAELVVAMNQNPVKVETAKALSHHERQTVAMIHRLIYGLPGAFYDEHVQKSGSTLGAVTSGGTVANITALWCARNASLGPTDGFAGVEYEGLPAALDAYGRDGAVIIGPSSMHYSFSKAAGLLGLGTRGLVEVATDHRNRVDVRGLRRAVAACRARNRHIVAIVGVAGTTDSGAVDPLRQVGEVAREANVHFHVDAAWCGALLFSERHRHKLLGIEMADSVTFDGHKQLYLPMGIGLVLFRDPGTARAIEKQANYIVRGSSVDLGKRALEGSRPGVVVFLHAALTILGRHGYAVLLDEGIRKAQYMADCVRARPDFELLVEPETNILAYRHVPERFRAAAARQTLAEADNASINEFNERLQRAQRQAGRSFVSRTTLGSTAYGPGQRIVALRAVLANPLTSESDIDAVLAEQAEIAGHLSSRRGAAAPRLPET